MTKCTERFKYNIYNLYKIKGLVEGKMRLMGIPIRVRDNPNANAKRQRGHPRHSFAFIDVSELDAGNSSQAHPPKLSVGATRGSTSIDEVTYTQPLISDDIPSYTLPQFLKRNRDQYVGALRMAGIPGADAEDIVQDAIIGFIEDLGELLNYRFTRKEIAEHFKPKFRAYVTAVVEPYLGQQSNVEVMEEPGATKDLDIDDNPFYYAVWHSVWDESPDKKDHIHESRSSFKEDPISSAIRNEESREKVFSWLAIEIYEAIKETQPNLLDLRKRYAFRPCDQTYQLLTFERGNLDEQKIADYVAFEAKNLATEELLSQPLFYEVLHHVLRTAQFSDDLESSLQEEPTFAPIRSGKRKIKYGDTPNKYGWNTPRSREAHPPLRTLQEEAIDALTLNLEEESGLHSDIARQHALQMPYLMARIASSPFAGSKELIK